MRRIEAIAAIDEAFAGRPLVMTCGAPCRELASLGRRPTHLYLLDSMGLAGAVGLGLALAGKGPLAAVEGDGSLLMGLSVLASIGFHRPPGLTLVVGGRSCRQTSVACVQRGWKRHPVGGSINPGISPPISRSSRPGFGRLSSSRAV